MISKFRSPGPGWVDEEGEVFGQLGAAVVELGVVDVRLEIYAARATDLGQDGVALAA